MVDMLILKNILFYNVNTFHCCRIVGIVNLKFVVFDELLAYPLKTYDLRPLGSKNLVVYPQNFLDLNSNDE